MDTIFQNRNSLYNIGQTFIIGIEPSVVILGQWNYSIWLMSKMHKQVKAKRNFVCYKPQKNTI